jgi:hypothetical protein
MADVFYYLGTSLLGLLGFMAVAGVVVLCLYVAFWSAWNANGSH